MLNTFFRDFQSGKSGASITTLVKLRTGSVMFSQSKLLCTISPEKSLK